jgi:hypothetical protein
MPHSPSVSIHRTLRKFLPPSLVEASARATGAFQRVRKVDAYALVWSLILGFSAGKVRTIAGLRRVYDACVADHAGGEQLLLPVHAGAGEAAPAAARRRAPAVLGAEPARLWRGRSVAVVGERIWDVVDRLQREELDVTVHVRSRHRVYAGRHSSEVRTFRVVGVRDEASGEYHLYITNIGVEALQPADIARVYAVRWEVELLFKELKSHYRLDQIPSRKRDVVEAMLYAALLSLAASRALLHALRSAVRPGFLLPARRWSVLLNQHAYDLLAVVVAGRDDPALLDLLLHEAPDPNRRRLHLLQSVERGTHAYRAPKNSASSRHAAA